MRTSPGDIPVLAVSAIFLAIFFILLIFSWGDSYLGPVLSAAFYTLIICAGLLLALFLYSCLKYHRLHASEDMKAAASTIVIAVAILAVDYGVFYPVADYDSVTYVLDLYVNRTASVIVPVPESQGLMDHFGTPRGLLTKEVVETARGTGLELRFNNSVHFKGTSLKRFGHLDWTPDLMRGSTFALLFTPDDNETHLEVQELRIIHQTSGEFRSYQLISYRHVDAGWNDCTYEVYPEN